jgi:hypothetical protein
MELSFDIERVGNGVGGRDDGIFAKFKSRAFSSVGFG